MKTIRWIKEGEAIPDHALFLNKTREKETANLPWAQQQNTICSVTFSKITEFLYEIPIDGEREPRKNVKR